MVIAVVTLPWLAGVAEGKVMVMTLEISIGEIYF